MRGKRKSAAERQRFGAGDVTRTHDLLITNQLHYRLCYTSERIYYTIRNRFCQELLLLNQLQLCHSFAIS